MEKAKGDVPAERPCIRCREPFPSWGFGNRICKGCLDEYRGHHNEDGEQLQRNFETVYGGMHPRSWT